MEERNYFAPEREHCAGEHSTTKNKPTDPHLINNKNTVLLPGRKAASFLGVSQDTLRGWADRGEITAVRLPSGHRRYRL